MTPFQLSALSLAEQGVTSLDLAGQKRRHDGTVADLAFLAGAAKR